MDAEHSDGLGTVEALWRYPVKSMSGAALDEAVINEGGILGDRAFAVIDAESGMVGSAKTPRKWSPLLELTASFVRAPWSRESIPPVRIVWPDGTSTASDAEGVDSRLSATLGRPVMLTAERPGRVRVERLDPLAEEETIVDIGELMPADRFSDYAALHIITTATLARLTELCPGSVIDARRFRPNVVVASPFGTNCFVENDWVGQELAIGDEVRLRISDPTPRCSIPTLSQDDLPKDPQVLRALVEHNRSPVPALDGQRLPCAGVYASVIRGGTVKTGDNVKFA